MTDELRIPGRLRVLSFVMFFSFFILLLGAGCRQNRAADTFLNPIVGKIAAFQAYPRWNIGGRVTIVDLRTIRVDDFTFNGGEVATDIRLQKNDQRVAVLKDITQQTFDHASFELVLPTNVELDDFNVVTVFSSQLGTPLSGARFQ